MSFFDRYSSFRNGSKIGMVPFIPIRNKSTDKKIIYRKKTMRLDKLSYDYYGDCDYAWLIMQSNPEYGSIESFIPDGVVFRIPFPLDETINLYSNDIISFKELNE
jgi:hypothetical protein